MQWSEWENIPGFHLATLMTEEEDKGANNKPNPLWNDVYGVEASNLSSFDPSACELKFLTSRKKENPNAPGRSITDRQTGGRLKTTFPAGTPKRSNR